MEVDVTGLTQVGLSRSISRRFILFSLVRGLVCRRTFVPDDAYLLAHVSQLSGIIPKALSRADRPGILLLTEGTQLRPEFQTISMSTMHFPFHIIDVSVLKEPSQAQKTLDKTRSKGGGGDGGGGGGGNAKKSGNEAWRYLPSFEELRESGSHALLRASEEMVPFMLWYFEDAAALSPLSAASSAAVPARKGRSVRRDEIAFISHRWLHPVGDAPKAGNKTGGRAAHPDDMKGSKLKFLQVRRRRVLCALDRAVID